MTVRVVRMKVDAANKRERRTRVLAAFTSAGVVSLTIAVALLGITASLAN